MPQHAWTQQPLVLKDIVVVLHDAAWIADHTALYINPIYDLTHSQVVAVTEEIHWSTGLDIEVQRVSLDDLLAQKVLLNHRDRIQFMAGRPIWRLSSMFVTDVRRGNRKDPVGETLRQAMAIQAVIGKAAIKGSLEKTYSRYPNRFPEGLWQERAETHAAEFIEHALGEPRFVDLEGDLVHSRTESVSRTVQDGAVANFTAIKCYKFEAARTIARSVIDKPKNKGAFGPTHQGERPHIFNSNMNRIADELLNSIQIFGFELDGIALGAWYHRVVTALRLGASAFQEMDRARLDVAEKMLDANVELQRLLRQNLTPSTTRRIEQLRALVSDLADGFDLKIENALVQVGDEQKGFGVFRCIASLDAAIIAFYGGVNARSVIPAICPEVPQEFSDVLESLVWLGHLQRHRVRDMDPHNARAFLSTVHQANGEKDWNLAVRNCREVGLSFLNDADRAELIAAAAEIVSTGGPRTVILSLREFMAEPKHDLTIAPPVEGGPALTDVVQGAQDGEPDEEPTTYYRFNAELGSFQSMFPELHLRSTFVNLPPLYRVDWAGRWRVERDQDKHFVGAVPA